MHSSNSIPITDPNFTGPPIPTNDEAESESDDDDDAMPPLPNGWNFPTQEELFGEAPLWDDARFDQNVDGISPFRFSQPEDAASGEALEIHKV